MTYQPKFGIMILSICTSTAYFGLAILGLGGIKAFFSHPPLVWLALVTLLLVVVAQFTQGNISAGTREDKGNRWVLMAFGAIGLLEGYLPALADRYEFWILGGDNLRWCGLVFYIIGGWLRIWPVFALGHRFSGLVAIQPEHTLVTTGVYGVIRHPSYLGLLIGLLGWGLAFRSAVGLVLAAMILWPLLARIRAEERLLLSQFGDQYQGYRQRTWRLIPGIY